MKISAEPDKQKDLISEMHVFAEAAQLTAIAHGYSELFDTATDVQRSITRLIEIKLSANILKEKHEKPSVANVAKFIGVTRNALYARLTVLDCPAGDILASDASAEDLIRQSSTLYELLHKLKSSLKDHKLEINKPLPNFKQPRTKKPVIKISPLARNASQNKE